MAFIDNASRIEAFLVGVKVDPGKRCPVSTGTQQGERPTSRKSANPQESHDIEGAKQLG